MDYGLNNAKFEVKHLLERVPRYQDLPPRPPENNALGKLEQGFTSKLDKTMKVQQQTLLHLLRVLASLCGLLGTAAILDSSSRQKQVQAPPEQGQAAQLLAQQSQSAPCCFKSRVARVAENLSWGCLHCYAGR